MNQFETDASSVFAAVGLFQALALDKWSMSSSPISYSLLMST